MQGACINSALFNLCSSVSKKLFELYNRGQGAAGISLRGDRHIRRRLLQIEPLEIRALMSADGLVSYIDPNWFTDFSADTALHAGTPALATESGAEQTPSIQVGVAGQFDAYDWIVQFDTQSLGGITSVAQVSNLFVGSGIEFDVLRGLGLVGQVLVRSSGASSDSVTQWLANNVNIAGFEQDSIRQLEATPNDPGTGQLYGMNKINASAAWNLTTGSRSVVVGVVDTGIDYTHPDLAANMWRNTGEIAGNGIDDDRNGFVDDVYGYNFVSNTANVMDDNGHGTHVSGTIAAVGNNSVGVAGVNWSASLMALKFLDSSGSGYVSDAVRAVNYATMMSSRYGVNVRVLNNSWGGGGYSAALDSAIAASNNAGILFVAAAGNSASNNDATAQYPANFSSANVISVAATNQNDQLANFSCYGATTVDLAAPGVSIYSTVPNNRYAVYSGTSMATPHVSGVAALAWAYKPTATVAEVRNALLQGVDKISALSGKMVSGGRLNAYNTLQLLGGAAPSGPVLGSLLVSPSSTVTKGASVALVAQGATSSNGVSAVYYYQDSNANGVFDTTDTCIGYDSTVVTGTAELSLSTSGMTPGTSRFFARALDRNNRWSAALSTTLTVMAADDCGNSAAAAASIGVNSTLAGSIETGGDQDWFKFQAVAGKRYVISTTLVGLADSVLTLYDRNGTTQLAYNDDIASNNLASRIQWTAPASGVYFLKTTAFDRSQTGGYRLNLALQNSSPVLQAIGNQTMSYRTDKLTVPLSASDPDGDKLTFSATAYTINPITKAPTSTPVAGNKVALSFSGNTLIVDPAAGYTGEFYVTVTASDGTNSNLKSFKVSVTNSAPLIRSIGDQVISSKAGGITIPLSVSDVDGDRLTLSAKVYAADPKTKAISSTPLPGGKVSMSLVGNQLRINRAAGYTGVFYVTLTVGDGANSVVKSFKVTATNATQQWLVPSSIKSLSAAEDISQQPASAETETDAASSTFAINLFADWHNILATVSYDVVGLRLYGNNTLLQPSGISAEAAKFAFHESGNRGASWLSDCTGSFSNVSLNALERVDPILDLGIGGRMRNSTHTPVDSTDSFRGTGGSEFSRDIEDALESWDNQSFKTESFDELFALLGNHKDAIF